MRVKRGTNRRDRRRKILARAKGYYLSKHNCYRIAKLQVGSATSGRCGSPASAPPRARTGSPTAA